MFELVHGAEEDILHQVLGVRERYVGEKDAMDHPRVLLVDGTEGRTVALL